MKWPWVRRSRLLERRESYSERLTQAVVEAASAPVGVDGLVASTAALETCAAVYSFAFAGADLHGPRARLVGRRMMATIGRRLIRNGDCAYLVDVSMNGNVEFVEASHWDVRGGWRPSTWRYRLDLMGPDRATHTLLVPAEQVLHFRYATSADLPWLGMSPMGIAGESARLHAALERVLRDESSGTRGYLLPVPPGEADDDDDESAGQIDSLKSDLRGLSGNTMLVETTSGGWGEGPSSAPGRDWQPSRIGPAFPEAVVRARRDTAASIAQACGVPLTILEGGQDASAQREGWRRFLHGSLQPLAEVVGEELSEKLGGRIEIRFENLFASDVQGRARAFQSMVDGGIDVGRAAQLSGLT